MNPDQIYEDLVDFSKLKNQMEKTLVDYNEFPGQVPMDIVLFRDAIEHGNLLNLYVFNHLVAAILIHILSSVPSSQSHKTTKRKSIINRYRW